MIENLNQLKFKNIYYQNNIFELNIINQHINKLTKYLQKNIKSDSPFVFLFAHNHIKSAIAYFAILKAGKIAVLIDPKSKGFQFNEILEDTNPAAIIKINSNTLYFKYEQEIQFTLNNPDFNIHSDLKNVCTIVYTNAEDGYYKGAMITQQNLLSMINTYSKLDNITKKETVCSLLPFSHLFGLVFGLLIPALSGASILICELNIFNSPGILQEIQDTSTSMLYSVPSFYYIFSKTPHIKTLTTNTHYFGSGGIKLPVHIYKKFTTVTGKEIREGYGLTETSPCCTCHPIDIDVNIDSIGKTMPFGVFVIPVPDSIRDRNDRLKLITFLICDTAPYREKLHRSL